MNDKSVKELERIRAGPVDAAMGCEHCSYGVLDERNPMLNLHQQEGAREFCDCEAGQMRSKRTNGTYVQADIIAEQRRAGTIAAIEKLFGFHGVPEEWLGYTTKGYVSMVQNDDGKKKFVEGLKRFFSEYPDKGCIDTADGPRHGIIAYGPSGTGKTGGMTPLFGKLVADGEIGLWVTFNRIMQLCKGNDWDNIRSRRRLLATVPVLFIDEMGNPDKDMSGYERDDVMFETIKKRHEAKLITFITSNLSPDEMASGFGQRTWRRVFELCAGIQVGGERIGGELVTDIEF